MNFTNASFAVDSLSCVRNNRWLFTNMSFTLTPGGALLVEGKNGIGKSSLLRILAGLLRPVTGFFLWGGTKVKPTSPEYASLIGYMSTLDAVKPVLTVAEHMQAAVALSGIPSSDFIDVLVAFELAELAKIPGILLSTGQQRRLSLARLVVRHAPLWLLDEPAAGLDQAGQKSLVRAISLHREKGGIVIITTHQPLDIPDASTITPSMTDEKQQWQIP